MICPKCGFEQPNSPECGRCGVIVAKARPPSPPGQRPPRRSQGTAPTAAAAGQRLREVVHQAAHTARQGGGQVAAAAGRGARGAGTATITAWQGRPPSLRHRILFFREAGRMLDRGIPIAEVLASVNDVLRRGALANALRPMADVVARGGSLADAMAAHPAVFDATELALVQTAEATGRLGDLFGRLQRRLEVLDEVRGKIVMSMVYPGLVLLLSCVTLPVATLFTDGAMAYFISAATNLALAVAAGVLCFGVLPALLRHPRVQPAVLRVAAWIPGPSRLIRRRRLALFFSALAAALECGVDLRYALTLACRAPGELAMVAAGERMIARLDGGASLSEVAPEVPGLDRQVAALLASGEKTGDLAQAAALQAAEQGDKYRAGVQVAGIVFRMAASLLITILVGLSIIGHFQKVLADPMAMMPAEQRLELQKELDRAQPKLR